jgi:transporter family-2 protein
MNSLLLMTLMFCGGIAVALQPSINARLAEKIGVVESSTVSFAVGTAALLLVVLWQGRGGLREIGSASWWELTGGLLGAAFVTLTILVVPRIGTASAMTATITAQLVTGLVIDHYGLFGLRSVPFDPKRGLGVALLLLGAALVYRR